MPPQVFVIPGLNGHPGLLLEWAPVLFPGWRASAFNHHADLATDGVDGLAERALCQLEATDGDVFVCGESFGGTVALSMARRAPERIRGLILFSAFGWHPSRLARRGKCALALWSFLGGRVGETMYRAGRLASFPTQLGLLASPGLAMRYMTRPRADVAAYRNKAELSLTFDARPWLTSLSTPAFILTGSWDPVVPASAGRELARCMPNTRLCTLRGGHLVHLVQAERVGHVVADWARDLQLT